MQEVNEKDPIAQKLKEISQQDLFMINKKEEELEKEEEDEDDYTLGNYDGF